MGISSITLLFPRFTKSRIRTKAIGTIRCNYKAIRILTFIDSILVDTAEISSSRLYGGHKKLFPALSLLPSILSIIAFSGWLLAWSLSIFPSSEPYIGAASWVLPRVVSDHKPSDFALFSCDGVPLRRNTSKELFACCEMCYYTSIISGGCNFHSGLLLFRRHSLFPSGSVICSKSYRCVRFLLGVWFRAKSPNPRAVSIVT